MNHFERSRLSPDNFLHVVNESTLYVHSHDPAIHNFECSISFIA